MIELSDILQAQERIKGAAVRTPLIESADLNALAGRRVLVKPENLQRTGSFKFRGAFTRLSQLDDVQRKAGVVAWSSGNHAQGIAASAQILGIHAAIVMPADAPATKVENTKAYGAEIVFYDRYTEDREEIGRALCKERGAVLVPSYDDLDIIAGQGTTGQEIAEDVRALGVTLDAALICCGGGGLIAGSATALKAANPDTDVFAVEPEGYDDHARSLVSGQVEAADTSQPSICDALLAPCPGKLTYPINSALLTGGLVVTEDEVQHAMRMAFRVLKLVVEPGGSVALAALLSGKLDPCHETVAIVLSGGNVDPEVFAKTLAA